MKKRVLSLITTLCLLFALLPTTAFAESCSHIDENKDHVCDKENCKATISTCYGGTATCSNKAVCDYCGKPYGGFDSSNHVGGTEIKNDRDATCTEEGYTGDTCCVGCGEKVSSGSSTPKLRHIDENKDHVCDRRNCKATISACYGGTATCSNKAVCDYCGKPYGGFDSSNHVGGTEIKNDRDATCTEEGYTGDTYCVGCGERVSLGSSTPKLGHIDENKDNVCDRMNCKAIISACEGGEANSNEVGDTGDNYCNGCDTKLSAVTKEATTTSTGTKTYTCQNCGHSYEEEIAELTSQSTSPQTGDNSYMALWLALLFISGGALVGTAAYGRKKKCSVK